MGKLGAALRVITAVVLAVAIGLVFAALLGGLAWVTTTIWKAVL